MLRRLNILIAIALIVAVISAGCARRTAKSDNAIDIKGSDTMVSLGQTWAQDFMKKDSGVRISVTGGGSGTGIAALINGSTDVAQASREMTSEEIEQAKKAGREPKEIPVALDALTVVVNPANPVKQLTIDQLSNIFTGKITNWSQVGGRNQKIVALSRERNSGTHVYFLEHVVRRGNAKGPEEFAPSILMLPSSQTIAEEVTGNPAAIGYFGLGWLDRSKQKPLAIAQAKGKPYVEPSVETATSGEYPISRKLYLYTIGEPKGNIKKFVDFTLSKEGRKIVEEAGFVRIPGE
ncbi:MAG: PstS family phosphate ABC transporter substrate-binding protein [Armatimonadota bacterium]|nr:PstS family phosphate ABC transporter substrate-binding protein [Armatimonadota bacterium]